MITTKGRKERPFLLSLFCTVQYITIKQITSFNIYPYPFGIIERYPQSGLSDRFNVSKSLMWISSTNFTT